MNWSDVRTLWELIGNSLSCRIKNELELELEATDRVETAGKIQNKELQLSSFY